MITSEARVLKFLSCHSAGHVFNVNECWMWLADRCAAHSVAARMALPSRATLRRYIRKHCAAWCGTARGLYVVPLPY